MINGYPDFLKLSDETDLDILNNCMETMVEKYQTELLPVAAQLTSRLVSKLYLVSEKSRKTQHEHFEVRFISASHAREPRTRSKCGRCRRR